MSWHVVVGDYPPGFTGGVASWTERVCGELSARGLELVLHARGSRGLGRMAEARHDEAQPFELARIRVHRWNLNQAQAVTAAVAPVLRPGDRVLATTWPLAPGLVDPCRHFGIPLLVVAHGSEVTRLDWAPAELKALASVARFGAVSDFLVQRLSSLGVTARVLPAPVESQVDPPGVAARKGLLVVARCTPLKGIERAIGLAEALGWPLTVVGEGTELAALRRRGGTAKVAVRFEGRLSWTETLERYRRARLLVQLSRVDDDGGGAEGLGLVVLEAIANGAPAAVSSVGGLPEAVGPGLVLDVPDDAEASARAVEAWLGTGDPVAQQRAWLHGTHGVGRCVDALLAMSQDRST